jgi:hypothetical protein
MQKLQNAVATSVVLSSISPSSASTVDIKLWLPQPLPSSQTFYVLTNVVGDPENFIGTLNSVLLETTFTQVIPPFLKEYTVVDPKLKSVIILKQIPGKAYKYSTTIPNDLTFQYITIPPGTGSHAQFLVVSVLGEVILGASGVYALLCLGPCAPPTPPPPPPAPSSPVDGSVTA